MSEMPSTRAEWLDEIVDRVANQHRAQAVRDALSNPIASLAGARLSGTLAIAEIADRHAHGQLLGSIVTTLVHNKVLRDDEETSRAVLEAILMFRSGGLTEGLWWEPGLLRSTLAELWATEARHNADSVTVRGALERCWAVDADSARAFADDPRVTEGLESFVAEWCEDSEVVRSYVESEGVRELRAGVAAQLPEFGHANADLIELAEWREVWQQLNDRLHVLPDGAGPTLAKP